MVAGLSSMEDKLLKRTVGVLEIVDPLLDTSGAWKNNSESLQTLDSEHVRLKPIKILLRDHFDFYVLPTEAKLALDRWWDRFRLDCGLGLILRAFQSSSDQIRRR